MSHNRVVILHDRVPPDAPADQQDALTQAAAVAAALQSLGYTTVQQAFDPDLPATTLALREASPVAVFNLVESLNGNGALAHIAPAWIATLGIPCSGSGAAAMLLSTDKLLAKRWMASHNIPCPGNYDEREPIAPGTLWIVKACNEDASIGLDAGSVVPAAEVAAKLAAARLRYGGEWLAERFIDGREFNIALLQLPDGVSVLPAAEITFKGFPDGAPRIVDYAAKWDPESFAYLNTSREFPAATADTSLIESMRVLALQCWNLFGLRGYARVDFRVDEHGAPWVLEVNANPCLAPDAGFAAALRQAGISFEEAISAIMAAAGNRARANNKN